MSPFPSRKSGQTMAAGELPRHVGWINFPSLRGGPVVLAVPRCTARQPHCRRPVRAAGLSQEATPRRAGRRRHATSGLLHSAFNQLPVLDVSSPRQDVALARSDAPYVVLNDFVKHANDGSAVRYDVQAPNATEPRCRSSCRGG